MNHSFKDGEITPAATVKEYLTVQNEGELKPSRENAKHFSSRIYLAALCGQSPDKGRNHPHSCGFNGN